MILLPLFAPLMLVVALLIKLDTPGPVFFKQTRIGRGNKKFGVLKFRSMTVEQCDAAGNTSTRRDDDRITRIGRILRKTSI
ncbi:sugar transferase, partial [Acinetobacter baumannii]